MQNNEPATKQDLLDLKASAKQDLIQTEERLIALIRDVSDRQIVSQNELEEHLTEKMRDMQTEVIRAFHGWGRTTDLKLRRISEFDERLGILEERISAIERGDAPPKPH